MNSVVLVGRLTHDPSIETVGQQGLPRCKFRLAVEKEGKRGEADFLNCTVFGKSAENLVAWKRKGDQIAVQGRIETGSYTNKEGRTVYTTDIICNRIEFISAGRNGGGQDAQYAPQAQYQPPQQSQPQYQQSFDDDLPQGFAEVSDSVPF